MATKTPYFRGQVAVLPGLATKTGHFRGQVAVLPGLATKSPYFRGQVGLVGLQHLVKIVEDEADALDEHRVVKGVRGVAGLVVEHGDAGGEHDRRNAIFQEYPLVRNAA